MDKKQLRLYAITDRKSASVSDLCGMVEQAIADNGATIIQLREKNVTDEFLAKEAKEVKKVCSRYGVPLIINDNAEVALRYADGVHLGQGDTPVSEVRKRVGGDFIIGATAKTVQQAIAAERAGASYLGSGAVFPSPTKKDAIRITYEGLCEICSAVNIPVVAIGGITAENINKLAGCGAAGAAVVSAVFGQKDIAEAAKSLRKLAESCFKEGV
ncbi:MAG: thiamine phosphate synthase [Clostridia bacterium]|nr:thiamine phosphate synthase [Clostridia bacterium]